MAHVAPIYPNFSRGEVSPLMFGRIDIEQYPSCLDKCRNVYIRPYGCASRVSGTEFVANAKNNSKVRLLKFVFSPTDSYIIECGAGYFRFYQNGAPVMSGANVYEVANSYYEDQLDSIQYVQLDDIIKLTCLPHNNDNSTARPKELIRNASNNWTFRDVTFTETPYLDQNTTDITLTPSAVTGNSITITSSADYFNSSMIGANMWIGTKVTDSTTNKDVQGYVKITAYTDAKHVTAEVKSKLSGTSATKLWGEGAFSDYRGYPAVVALYDGRLYYARTPYQPRNVYGSKPYAYETFTPAVDNEDDAGINIQLATNANGDGSDIKWMIGASYLLCGTYGGEFVVRGTGDGAITPTDISARQRTNWGGESIQPIVAGTFIHFIQRNGNKLRQFQYDYYYDAYKAVDVSIFSEHLLASPIKQMALQKNPDSIIYLMREDGKVVMLTLEQDQSVQAWSLLEDLGAEVESIQTIPSYDGNYDEVYMLMNRKVYGTTLEVTSSNQSLNPQTTYSGTKETEGIYTETLKCTTAGGYSYNSNVITAYGSPVLDADTGEVNLTNGDIGFKIGYVGFGFVGEDIIKVKTGTNITTLQEVLATYLTSNDNNYFVCIQNSALYKRINEGTLTKVADISQNQDLWFKIEYTNANKSNLYYSTNGTSYTAIFSNLSGDMKPTRIGDYAYSAAFRGTADLLNSTVRGSENLLKSLSDKWTSLSTGQLVNLSSADYMITYTGFANLNDTLTLTYTTGTIAPVRYIERITNPLTPENRNDWWYVRSGLKYDGFELTKGKALTLSANSGTVTATAGSSIFTSSMVGNRIRFIDEDYNILGEGEIKTYTSGTVVTLDVTTPFQAQSLAGGRWGISTESVSGLEHLNNKEVAIYSDCQERESKTVSSGSITTDDAFIIIVGLPYQSYITTMPMEAGSQNGTAVGKRKRISEMAIRVFNSLGVKVGRDLDNLYDTIYEQKEPFTGVIPNIKYNQGWVWDANITVEQSHPYPMNILSIAPIVTEVDK